MSVEICIPGVNRKDIKLHMNDTYLNLTAPREDFEYVTAASFCCPVNSKKAQANYTEGRLKICVPLKEDREPIQEVTVS
jgi:HSP20 family molecular chaperone IbpA